MWFFNLEASVGVASGEGAGVQEGLTYIMFQALF